MSDDTTPEIEQSADPVESSASPPHEAAQGSQSDYGGFETPYAAFKSLPDFAGQDDLAIARNLYQAYSGYGEAQRQLQQYQNIIPHATEYLQNKQAYEQWKAAQAQAQAPKPAEKPKWWNPPSVDDSYKSWIIRDPSTGKEIIAPDAPYEAKVALQKYQAYTADFARKFVTDPENTLKPFIEDVARQKAEELVQAQLGQYTAQNYVQSLEQQNSDWLYDQTGNVSREGQAIQAYIQQASEIGISNPEARWKYATSMLQRDLLNLRYQQLSSAPPAMAQGFAEPAAPQAPPADPVAQQNMQFLRERATRTPNRSAGTSEPRAPRQRMSFEDRLKSQLVTDGVI